MPVRKAERPLDRLVVTMITFDYIVEIPHWQMSTRELVRLVQKTNVRISAEKINRGRAQHVVEGYRNTNT